MALGESPAFYHLGVDTSDLLTITVDAHPEAFKKIALALEGSPEEGGAEAVSDSPVVDEWARLSIPIPRMRQSGDYEPLYAASKILSIATTVLNTPEYSRFGADSDTPQFMTIRLDCDPDADYTGAPVFVKIKPALIRWLKTADTLDVARQTSQTMGEASAAIQQPFSPILPEDYPSVFPVHIRTPRDIHLDVPGDSTGLDSYHPHKFGFAQVEDEDEYRLIPHNANRVKQQFTLLAGIAYIGQRALSEST